MAILSGKRTAIYIRAVVFYLGNAANKEPYLCIHEHAYTNFLISDDLRLYFRVVIHYTNSTATYEFKYFITYTHTST